MIFAVRAETTPGIALNSCKVWGVSLERDTIEILQVVDATELRADRKDVTF